MRVYLQWATSQPQEWQPYDITSAGDVRRLARKPVPENNPVIDSNPGWINAVNCQGVIFGGYDHIAIEYLRGNTLVITGWEDDPDDFGDGFWATQFRFEEPRPDPRAGGQMNTVQTVTRWATAAAAKNFPPGTVLRPWEEFSPPPADLTFHGVWLPEDLFAEHQQRLTPHGWREWL